MLKYTRIVMIAVLCLAIVGCERHEASPTTITVIHAWGSTEADHVAMRDIYQDFQEANPDINIEFIAMPTRDEMIAKLEDMIIVGNIPDVVDFGGMGENYVYNFMVENDMLIDVMPYIEEDAEFASSISQSNLQYWTTEDKQLYNVSYVLSLGGGYWYNMDILEATGIDQIPTEWDGFFDMCNRIDLWAQDTGESIRVIQPSAEGYLYFVDHILMDDVKEYRFSLNSRVSDFSDENIEIAIERIKRLYAYTTTEGTQYSYRDETSLFNQGQIAIYVNGVWGASMISDDITASYALLPTDSNISTSCQSACLGYVMGDTKDDGRQEASIRFLQYMMSEDVQREIFDASGQIPADFENIVDSYEDNSSKIYLAAQTVLEATRKIEVTDNFWSAEQKSQMQNSILEMLSGELKEQDFKRLLE